MKINIHAHLLNIFDLSVKIKLYYNHNNDAYKRLSSPIVASASEKMNYKEQNYCEQRHQFIILEGKCVRDFEVEIKHWHCHSLNLNFSEVIT